MTKEETIRTFYGTSHEVAGHGAVHAFLDKISLPEAIREVVACREQLEEMFDTVVDGYAYAYNGYTDEVVDFLKAFGITYARTTQSSLTFALPKDWLRLQPTCHLPGEKSFGTLCEKFFESSPADPANVKHRESWLFYAWGHSFEFDDNDCWDVIEDFAARAYQNRDSVWFATNGEIYRYCKAYENLIFSCDGERVFNPSAMSVWLEVRGKTYEVKPNQTLKFDRF
jgi:hypothetical protein